MLICGLKVTHDGAVALIDGNELKFCYEMEKLGDHARHAVLSLSRNQLEGIFNSLGYQISDIDRWVIDGWHNDKPIYDFGDGATTLPVADYGYHFSDENVLQARKFTLVNGQSYSSYLHIAGHIGSAYMTSPFALRGEDAYILVWDGGMLPQLFFYRYHQNVIENVGPLFPLTGLVYCFYASNFEPFITSNPREASIPGKVMAYIALGNRDPNLIKSFWEILSTNVEPDREILRPDQTWQEIDARMLKYTAMFCAAARAWEVSAPDALLTFHCFLEDLLTQRLDHALAAHHAQCGNLCFVGGSALNIKWNSALRALSSVEEMWVPPFPNDSGSAIGTACCEMLAASGQNVLKWNVYSGPEIQVGQLGRSWTRRASTIAEVAKLLHETGQPILFLNGRAELGPRALGNRSILAPAVSAEMKGLLNCIKQREDYRPVAPVCLEKDAANIFSPGISDPYMLFDHHLKAEWKERVPAVCHLDGTARLQTVNAQQNPLLYELLIEYRKLSGIPLLCNTSANFKGRGFFSNALSAMEWGKVPMIWCNGEMWGNVPVTFLSPCK